MTTDRAWFTGIKKLAIDTAPIIYFVEAHPVFDHIVTEIFQSIDAGEITGFTSVITLCEVITKPLSLQDTQLADRYRALLIESLHFNCCDINSQIAESAGQLRAQYQLRTPDALQIAVAIHAECDAFLTNDKRLRQVNEIQIIVLDDLVASAEKRN